ERWEAAATERPTGHMCAHLQRLTPPTSSHAAPTATPPSQVNSWPEIDLSAETLRQTERYLGRLELNPQPRGADWRIDTLRLINDDGRLYANGWWRCGGGNEHT